MRKYGNWIPIHSLHTSLNIYTTIVTVHGRLWNVGKSQIVNDGTVSKVKRFQESNFYSFALCNCDSEVAIKVRLVVSRAWIFYGSGF